METRCRVTKERQAKEAETGAKPRKSGKTHVKSRGQRESEKLEVEDLGTHTLAEVDSQNVEKRRVVLRPKIVGSNK